MSVHVHKNKKNVDFEIRSVPNNDHEVEEQKTSNNRKNMEDYFDKALEQIDNVETKIFSISEPKI